MRLYPDRLELSGWHLGGRFRRWLPLREILQADARPGRLVSGEAVRLDVEQALQWKAAIDLRLELLDE